MAEVIQMPKLSDTMTTGTLVRWLKKEGESVSPGDMIAEVETDKATMEVENFVEGILLKRYVLEGSAVPIGGPICAIGQKGETAPSVEISSVAGSDGSKDQQIAIQETHAECAAVLSSPNTNSKSNASLTSSNKASGTPSSSLKSTSHILPQEQEPIKSSPLARKIAAEQGIDLKALSGSGPHGRIVKEDVLNAKAQRTDSKSRVPQSNSNNNFNSRGIFVGTNSQPVQQQQDVPVSNLRAIIARRLLESKTQIPHFYIEIEVNADPLLHLRESINHSSRDITVEQGGLKLTVNDFILKATAEALRRVPQINVSWNNTHIIQHANVHLSFGVAIDEGLVTPVIREAHTKTLQEISLEAKELIQKARSKKLKPEEMSGSTFTVTNLGMYGISTFFGIINPPNAGILSVGAAIKQPIVDINNTIIVGHRMVLGFSGDHRVIDGAVGAQFLSALKEILETPALMLL